MVDRLRSRSKRVIYLKPQLLGLARVTKQVPQSQGAELAEIYQMGIHDRGSVIWEERSSRGQLVKRLLRTGLTLLAGFQIAKPSSSSSAEKPGYLIATFKQVA